MGKFKVAETFVSINGEGPKAGQLSLFIRFIGCNLDCNYCDTKWANEEDAHYFMASTDDIVLMVKKHGVRNVTITGGEPLWRDDIRELLEALSLETDHEIEIETNGSIPLKDFADMKNPPAFNMDYKLPGSGMENMMCLENFGYLKAADTVKFVVSDLTDLEKARNIIDEYNLTQKCHVYLSPCFGRIQPSEMVDFMKKYRMNNVNLQLQIHKVIWDANMRGV